MSEKSDRFAEPIKKKQILNFAIKKVSRKEYLHSRFENSTGKKTRDIFGRLQFLEMAKQINVKMKFAYPLVPEPPCFCHPDGVLRDSPKSKIFHYWKV